mgnify:CR=1 FL=1
MRKREKMSVVGTQKGPAARRVSCWGISRRGRSGLAPARRTVEIWHASENLRHVVLSRDKRLPAAVEDRHRVDVKVARVCASCC